MALKGVYERIYGLFDFEKQMNLKINISQREIFWLQLTPSCMIVGLIYSYVSIRGDILINFEDQIDFGIHSLA